MRASPESSAPARRAGDRPAGCLPQRLKPLSHAHGVSSLLASRGGDALGQVEQLGALVHLLEHRDRRAQLGGRRPGRRGPLHALSRLRQQPLDAPDGHPDALLAGGPVVGLELRLREPAAQLLLADPDRARGGGDPRVLQQRRDRLLALARLAKCRSWAVMEPRHASRRLADHPAPNGLRARSSRLTLKWAATSPRMPASVPTRSASWAGTVDMVLAALCRRQAHVAPGLARDAIAEDLQGAREVGPGEVPG